MFLLPWELLEEDGVDSHTRRGVRGLSEQPGREPENTVEIN